MASLGHLTMPIMFLIILMLADVGYYRVYLPISYACSIVIR